MRTERSTWLLLAGAIALAFAVATPAGRARADDEDDDEDEKKETIPFEEAHLFFELNDTDGDLGIQGLIDGEAWRKLEIEDPAGRKILDVRAKGRLGRQGMTEVFFESDEPSFDELSPEDFFARFLAGEYEISGNTLEGEELESTTEVSHVMPAPPGNVVLSGVPAVANCDVVPLPSVETPVVIDWDPVMTSHPAIGEAGAIEIVKYTLVLEREEPELLIFSVELPPGVTQFEVPEDFTDLGEEFKFEIQVKAENGNQTVVESCFELE